MASLPVINFSKIQPLTCDYTSIFAQEGTKDLAKSFYNALSTWGFLYITGHGIPDQVIDNCFQASKEFFHPSNREIHTKFYRKKGVKLGYVDGINERDIPENPIDLKQGFDFTLESSAFGAILDAQKTPIKILYQYFEKLSQFILRFLSVSLDKEIGYFLKGHQKIGDIQENSSTMRMLYYKAVNGEVLEKQSRMSEHCDFGTFTMLIQDQIGGLQVKSPNGGGFVDAPPIKNALIFNVGDLLQEWSQMKLKSTLHRVVLPKEMIRLKKSRQSIVYFTNPDNSYDIEGIDENGNNIKKSVIEHIEERNNTTIFELDALPVIAS